MIRVEAGMPTSRFVCLLGIPERSYRRWQHRQRHGQAGARTVAGAGL
jgi:putative transposase